MNEIKPKLIRADVLMDHFEKMHKIGILQSIDDIRFAIMDAPEVEAVTMEEVELLVDKVIELLRTVDNLEMEKNRK